MKKFFLFSVISLATLMSSCSSSDNDNDYEDDVNALLKLPYSTLSPEDQKSKLALEGEAILKQVDALPNEKAIGLLANFSEISYSLFDLFDLGENNDEDVPSTLITLSQFYGEYTYQESTDTWTKTADDKDKFVAIFPATSSSTSNNGKIELTGEASDLALNYYQLPKKATATFYVNNEKVGDASLNTTGLDKSNIVETANIIANTEVYKATIDVNKKGTNNSIKAKILNGSNLIIDLEADLAASITIDNMSNGDYSSVKDGNVKVNLGSNLVIVGYVDGAKFITELQKINTEINSLDDQIESGQITWEDYDKKYAELEKKQVDAFNTYSNIALVSTKDKYKIAKVTLRLDIDAEDYYSTNEVVQLTFNDDTKVDADVYFGTGFDKIIKMASDIFNKF